MRNGIFRIEPKRALRGPFTVKKRPLFDANAFTIFLKTLDIVLRRFRAVVGPGARRLRAPGDSLRNIFLGDYGLSKGREIPVTGQEGLCFLAWAVPETLL